MRWYEERLTARGRFLLWTALALGVMGLDTRSTQIYVLFAGAFGLTVAARLAVTGVRPRARLDLPLPSHATAGVPLAVRGRVVPEGASSRDLTLLFPPPNRPESEVEVLPREMALTVARDPVEVVAELRPRRRGRHLLRPPTLRATDPLGLANGPAADGRPWPLVVYPPYYTLERFDVPAGRRYQPGGIPLSSSTADATEFVGTRDYREGDPLRNIHWRSWARRGAPVVKEYEEEYFCRIALVLDTFVPARASAAEARRFEAAISVLASVADHYSRSDYIVDILAAGPEIYDVSTGRSLAYLENVLDVLACIEPSREPPFEKVEPALFDRLSRITTLVAVLQDWDDRREALLRRVRALGTAVHVIVVHEGGTTRPVEAVGEELGPIELLTPDEVDRRVEVERARGESVAGVPGLGSGGAPAEGPDVETARD